MALQWIPWPTIKESPMLLPGIAGLRLTTALNYNPTMAKPNELFLMMRGDGRAKYSAVRASPLRGARCCREEQGIEADAGIVFNNPITPPKPALTSLERWRRCRGPPEQSGRLVIHDKPPIGAAAGARMGRSKGVIHLVPTSTESSALSVVLHESAHLMRDDRFSPRTVRWAEPPMRC